MESDIGSAKDMYDLALLGKYFKVLHLLFYHKVKKNKRNTKGILNKIIGHIQNQNFRG